MIALEGPADADVAARGELGGYEMIEEAGRGGMGRVWKARQPGLGRLVAIKILPGGEWAGASMRLRFQREAEAAARLRHPHLVAVHDCGEHEGTLWYSMDFIEGESLADRIKGAPLAPRDAAVMMEKVTRAVAFAHSQGVWHRDLKPANILVDAAGEPHVTDFGLAHTEASTGLTVSGALAGSPHYLPPERAGGSGKEGDAKNGNSARGPHDALSLRPPEAAGDIYALGATLYHALTGRPPFSGPNVAAVLTKVIADPPARPSSLRPDIPRDLENICLKCMEKSPAARYHSAGSLADDLRCFLDGLPVRARPISAPARLWRWAHRRPALASLSAALVLALGGIISLMAVSAQRSSEEGARYKLAAAAAEKAEHKAQIESGIADARSARLSDTFASRDEGLGSLSAAAGLSAAGERHEPTLRALRDEAAALLSLPVTDWSERSPVPDELAGSAWWVERTRQWIMVRDPKSAGWFIARGDGSGRVTIPVGDPAFSTTCSPDGRYAATQPGAADSTLWKLTPPLAEAVRKVPGGIVDWSADSRLALVFHQTIAVHEVESGKVLCSITGSPSFFSGRFNSDGRRAATVVQVSWNSPAAHHELLVFDTHTGGELWRARLQARPVGLAWSMDDAWLAVMDDPGRITLFSAADGYQGHVLSQVGGAVQGPYTPGVEFTRDGFLASHNPRNTVAVWDPASGRLLRTQIATGWHSGGVRDGIKYGPLATRRTHPSWLRIERGIWSGVAVPVNGEEPFAALSWSPDGSLLAASHPRGSWLWDARQRRLRGAVSAPGAGDSCQHLEFMPGGDGFVASYPGGLWLQSIPKTGSRSLAVPLKPGAVDHPVMARAQSAPLMAVAGRFSGEAFRVLLYAPGQPGGMRMHDLPHAPTAIALNAAGSRLAVGMQHPQDSLHIFDPADFRRVSAFIPLGTGPHALHFDPLSPLLSFDVFNAHIGDPEAGLSLGDYSSWSQTDGIFGSPAAAFDPAGKWYAVTEPPRRIILYRRVPPTPAAPQGWSSFVTLESPSGAGLTRLSFSPDGKQLAAATTRPAFELWDLATLEAELVRQGIW